MQRQRMKTSRKNAKHNSRREKYGAGPEQSKTIRERLTIKERKRNEYEG